MVWNLWLWNVWTKQKTKPELGESGVDPWRRPQRFLEQHSCLIFPELSLHLGALKTSSVPSAYQWKIWPLNGDRPKESTASAEIEWWIFWPIRWQLMVFGANTNVRNQGCTLALMFSIWVVYRGIRRFSAPHQDLATWSRRKCFSPLHKIWKDFCFTHGTETYQIREMRRTLWILLLIMVT